MWRSASLMAANSIRMRREMIPNSVIPALVLAAGASTRMGTSKAMLPLGRDHTFLTRIIQTCHDAGVHDVVVVVGHEAESVVQSVEVRGLLPRFVVNTAFEQGQFSSILRGLRVIDRPGVTGFLLLLVDVPLVSASTLRAVMARY